MKSAVILVVCTWLVIWGLSDEVLSEPVVEDGMSNYMQLVCALVYNVSPSIYCMSSLLDM